MTSYLRINHFEKNIVSDVFKTADHPHFDFDEHNGCQSYDKSWHRCAGHGELLREFFDCDWEESDFFVLDKEKLEALIKLFDEHDWESELPTCASRNVLILEELNTQLEEFDFESETYLTIAWLY